MFNLETAISEWRQEMRRAVICNAEILDELEGHLREDLARQVQAVDEQLAFSAATRRIGRPALLGKEFSKMHLMKWNRPLAFAAWFSFAVSFFLPALSGMRGWQCAGAVAGSIFDLNPKNLNWADVHYSLLTLSNLFMIASPLLFATCSKKPRVWNCLRFINAIAWVFVWSFFIINLAQGGLKIFQELFIGFYLWTTSFLLLMLSTFKWPKFNDPQAAMAH